MYIEKNNIFKQFKHINDQKHIFAYFSYSIFDVHP